MVQQNIVQVQERLKGEVLREERGTDVREFQAGEVLNAGDPEQHQLSYSTSKPRTEKHPSSAARPESSTRIAPMAAVRVASMTVC